MTNESVLRAVLGAVCVGVEEGQTAVREHFTDDCVWMQSGFPTTTGPEEAAQLLADLATSLSMARIEVRWLNVASGDDVVFTERLDWLVQADGNRMGPSVVVSVTKFRDGRICEWRECFETSGFEHLLTQSS